MIELKSICFVYCSKCYKRELTGCDESDHKIVSFETPEGWDQFRAKYDYYEEINDYILCPDCVQFKSEYGYIC